MTQINSRLGSRERGGREATTSAMRGTFIDFPHYMNNKMQFNYNRIQFAICFGPRFRIITATFNVSQMLSVNCMYIMSILTKVIYSNEGKIASYEPPV